PGGGIPPGDVGTVDRRRGERGGQRPRRPPAGPEPGRQPQPERRMRAKAIGAQIDIETKLTLRRGESLIVTLGIPVGILIFFGNVDLVDTGYRDPLDFLVPGVLALAVMSTAMVIGTIAFSGLGLLMAGTLRAEATLAVANGGYLLLLVLGGMAYPLERLPLALRDVARVLPAAPLAECLRGALTGVGIPGARLSILIGWAVLAPLLAARSFRWEE